MESTFRDVLAALWLEVLGQPPGRPVADDEKFFELGGSSVQVIMLHALIEERTGAEVDIVEHFDVLLGKDFSGLVELISANAPQPDPPRGTERDQVRIGERIAVLAADRPDRPAVIMVRPNGDETAVTWGDLERRSNAAAHVLQEAGASGDSVVVVSLPNGIAHITATLAAWKLGALVLPVNPALPDREHAAVLKKLPDAIVIGNRPGDLAPGPLLAGTDETPPPPRGTPWSAVLSGGSTGTPRVIRRRHPWLYDPDAPAPAGYRLPGMRPDQTQLVSLPMYHGGFLELHNGLAMGHRVVVMEMFSPRLFLELIERHRVNFLVTVPTIMRTVASVKDADTFDLSSVEVLYHQSGPCPPSVKRRWLELLPPERVYEDYGSTENIGFTRIRGDEWLAHPGSVGRPADGVVVRILDEDGNRLPPGTIGEIFLSAPGATQPLYLGGGPQLREHDGFRSVGDLGHLDEDGYLYLADRRKDAINVGGVTVYPAEIEAVLLDLAGVADAAVVARPHDALGQRPHALLVRAEGSPVPSQADAEAHCAAHLATAKRPASYEFVPSLPRNEAGKLRRSEL
ncbi:AMP-binding protein [Glycomyces sp. L485]|uniref:AMP-binding protein n=1 Tax=Glycomyces sp. L485 TaxID=2909235 RepID=UPI001F4B175B|nr:AMP-binding protein [Glycomyces sp. L485]MCH7231773.1 AMP-binding protein [Glycomyces sp. L485]